MFYADGIVSISNLNKVYAGGFKALTDINLNIQSGEIFALLGPNGAGKTTLIRTICGLSNPSSGTVSVKGFDVVTEAMQTRSAIGLVPQELTTDAFETVWNAVKFSRGLFGKAPNSDHLEKLLRDLSLWDKKDNKLRTLSGGMKRRLMIAKALSHEPEVLFLDEPTAGVDVELRKDMWKIVRELRKSGVTIILTTHYIEEAEEMADRIGIINKGKLIVVEEKRTLMKKLGKKQLNIDLAGDLKVLPPSLSDFDLSLVNSRITYSYSTEKKDNGISELLEKLRDEGLGIKDINTQESSLEEIFVSLVHQS
ncbi:MAG: ABC transporter ATP-binding protein [Bdellovibrionota bacterium]